MNSTTDPWAALIERMEAARDAGIAEKIRALAGVQEAVAREVTDALMIAADGIEEGVAE